MNVAAAHVLVAAIIHRFPPFPPLSLRPSFDVVLTTIQLKIQLHLMSDIILCTVRSVIRWLADAVGMKDAQIGAPVPTVIAAIIMGDVNNAVLLCALILLYVVVCVFLM